MKTTRVLLDTGSLQRMVALAVEFELLAKRIGTAVAAGRTLIEIAPNGEITITCQDGSVQHIEPARTARKGKSA